MDNLYYATRHHLLKCLKDMCLVFDIYFWLKKIDTHKNLNGVVRVKEQVVTLFSQSIISSLTQKKMDSLYCATTNTMSKYSRDVSYV